MRIVSFLPSATEIVCDLGLEKELLGVTFECSWPNGVKVGREIVVNTFIDPSLTPGEISSFVSERVREGLSLYKIEDTALQKCDPDLILSQDICGVCAVPAGDIDAAVTRLNCHAEILQIDPHTLDDVIASIGAIAHAAGVPERGDALMLKLRNRLSEVRKKVESLAAPSVFVLEWIEPAFSSGHWVPDIILSAGGTPLLANSGSDSVVVTWDAIREAAPDIVLVAPCGYGLDESVEQAKSILDKLPNCQVWAIDADAVIVRPGPRLIDGVEAIAAALHGVGVVPPEVIRRVR
jgi:iron complex transport system substrate-binding protein